MILQLTALLFPLINSGVHLDLKEEELKEVRITHIGLIFTSHPSLPVT